VSEPPIDPLRWSQYAVGDVQLDYNELLSIACAPFECARCGRKDLPLALFHVHNKSCAFEAAIGKPAIQMKEKLEAKIEDKDERIALLESGIRDAEFLTDWLCKRIPEGTPYDGRGVGRFRVSWRKMLGKK